MLRIGCMIIFTMNGFYVLGAIWFLVLVLGFGWLPPQFSHLLSWEEIFGLSPRVVAATKYMAIIFHSICIGSGILTHMVTWKGLLKGKQWALWTIVIAWGTVATATLAADLALGGLLFGLNMIGNVPFLAGIILAGYGLYVQQAPDVVAVSKAE